MSPEQRLRKQVATMSRQLCSIQKALCCLVKKEIEVVTGDVIVNVELDSLTDIMNQVLAKTKNYVDFCNIESGEICAFDVCTKPDGSIVYVAVGSTTEIPAAEFEGIWQKNTGSIYEELECVDWYDITDKKFETPIPVLPRRNTKTGKIEYFLLSDKEFLNNLTKEDYIMSNERQVRPREVALKTTKKKLNIEFATTGAPQDIIADAQTDIDAFIATLKEPLIEGARWAVICADIDQNFDKTPIWDDLTEAAFTTTSEAQVQVDSTLVNGNDVDLLVAGAGARSYGVEAVDNGACVGCIDEACIIDVGGVTVTGAVGASVGVCYTFGQVCPKLESGGGKKVEETK